MRLARAEAGPGAAMYAVIRPDWSGMTRAAARAIGIRLAIANVAAVAGAVAIVNGWLW